MTSNLSFTTDESFQKDVVAINKQKFMQQQQQQQQQQSSVSINNEYEEENIGADATLSSTDTTQIVNTSDAIFSSSHKGTSDLETLMHMVFIFIIF